MRALIQTCLVLVPVPLASCSCEGYCSSIALNATVSCVGYDPANRRVIVAIDQDVAVCESSCDEDVPDSSRDLLEVDLDNAQWRLTTKVAEADDLAPHSLPLGTGGLFRGEFGYGCEGCELILRADNGAAELHFATPTPPIGQDLIVLTARWQDRDVLACAMRGYETVCAAF
ncbi:MAG: hypothetical protein V2A73_21435 [Pseudomonadota bacterium]